jgi:hypothetical protein
MFGVYGAVDRAASLATIHTTLNAGIAFAPVELWFWVAVRCLPPSRRIARRIVCGMGADNYLLPTWRAKLMLSIAMITERYVCGSGAFHFKLCCSHQTAGRTVMNK